MIKAAGKTHSGQGFILLGLSRENTELLHAGRPIQVNTRDLLGDEGPMVYLIAGENEDDLARDLQEIIGPATVVDRNALLDGLTVAFLQEIIGPATVVEDFRKPRGSG